MTDDQIEAEIQAKGLNAPRLSPEAIDATIIDEYYFTAADGVRGEDWDKFLNSPMLTEDSPLNRLTFCVLVLRNGYTVTGESAPVSAENFDAELGRKIARQHARDKIWALEGYLLRQRLYEGKETQPAQ